MIKKNKTIKVFLIEDDSSHVRHIQYLLSKIEHDEFDFVHVERLSDGLKLLEKSQVDVILLDLGLPDSQGLNTFFRIYEKFSELPIVVFTILDDEEIGIRAVREGAQDYLVKGQVDHILLARAIRYAIERQNLLIKIKTLHGMLPICSSCKKIRDDEGYWNEIEKYLADHSDVEFTHGICPDCLKELYPETYYKQFGDSSEASDDE